MKKSLILLFSLMVCLSLYAQGQDIRSLLDSAYNAYESNKDCIFSRNFSLYNSDSYKIERRLKNKDRKIKKRNLIITDSCINVKNWKPNHRTGNTIIGSPTISLFRDSIIIHTGLLSANEKGYYYGISDIALFVLDASNNKWMFVKNWRPDLEFRKKGTFDDLAEECFQKAVSFIQEKSKKENISIYRIAEYWPNLNSENVYPTIPSGANPRWFKDKADYFVGYPEASLNGNTITVTLKIIESDKITDIHHLKYFDTVSLTYDFSKNLLYSRTSNR